MVVFCGCGEGGGFLGKGDPVSEVHQCQAVWCVWTHKQVHTLGLSSLRWERIGHDIGDVNRSRVSRALSARVWALTCSLKALGSHRRVLSRGVTWSELCFEWPSGSHVGVALLKQEAEAGRMERR